MSNLKDAIKTLTTEGTKKRYWPSKNPIDDPADFPGERNFEEEAEITDDVQLNRFKVKDLMSSIAKRIRVISKEGGWTPEAEWLDWLEDTLGRSKKQSITRPEFLEVLKHWRLNTKTRIESDGWGNLNIKEVLDNAMGGAKELYADNVGAYGSMKGEEEDEYGRDQGAMNQHDDEHYDEQDPRRQSNLCGSCEGDGCHLCDYTGEYEDEENEEQDVSKFDYVNIIPEKNGKFTVKGYDSFPSHSVMAGQVRKNFLASFDSVEAAQAAFPTAKMSHHMMEPENSYDHLENEEENNWAQEQGAMYQNKDEYYDPRDSGEHGDCQRCGNTGYAMDTGKTCPDCPEGKAEREEFKQDVAAGIRTPTENEEHNEIIYPDKKPEWSKNSELMPHVGAANKEKARERHTARMQQSGDKYWSIGSNQSSEENEEHKDCHQCGNTGFDLGTNKPCASCPEGEYERNEASKRASTRTFKQMFPTDKK